MNKLENHINSVPSEFKDPFSNDAIERVEYNFYKKRSLFRQDKFHRATVYFSKGETSGHQDFYDDDPQLIFKRVQSFINNLN